MGTGAPAGGGAAGVLAVLHEVADAVHESLKDLSDWGLAGTRDGQYHCDIVADAAAVRVISAAGWGVVSEESGTHSPGGEITVVLDPVDGSTNASRGLPWWATSACALDRSGPLAAVVANHATGTRFEACRGGGARRDGSPIAPSGCQSMSSAILAVSGYPPAHLGWSQLRSLGAAALDLCAVACGSVDVFVDFARHSLAPWDYLAGILVCSEAGAAVSEAFGRDLVVSDPGARRTVLAAATPSLLEQARSARLAGEERSDGPWRQTARGEIV